MSDALNGTAAFIEFEPYGGERAFLAKAQLASVQLVGVPKAATCPRRTRDGDRFDPHAILGVAANAGWEEIRQAYRKLAKSYHPDRYASAELPVEVQDYLAAMARRVNAAYAALEVPRQAAKIPPPPHGPPPSTRAPRPDPLTGRACRGAALMSRVQTVTLCEPALSYAPSRRARPGIC